MQNKKAQIGIIVLILIILIVIVSVIILWNVINSLVKEKGEEAEIGGGLLAIDLKIEEVIFFETGALKVEVKRGAGKGEIDSLRFIFQDINGINIIKEEKEVLPEELETKIYNFAPLGIGKIKSVSIFSVVGGSLGKESKKEASEILKIPNSLVSWWRFDGDTDDFVGDNNGVLIGEASFERGRLFLETLEGHMSIENSTGLDLSDGIGISFWIKTNSNSGSVIKKGENYEVSLSNGKVKFSYTGKERISYLEINDNEWHHIVISMFSTYIDGVSDIVFDVSGRGIVNEEEVIIGEGLNGFIDEVMIFDKALSGISAEGLFENQKISFIE